MIVRHFLEVQEVTALKGANGVSKRTLIGKDEAAPNFFLRRFRIDPHGNTPRHSHSWEHEIYVLSGKGTVLIGTEESGLREGFSIYIAPYVEHQIKTGEETLEFLCIIPAIEEA